MGSLTENHTGCLHARKVAEKILQILSGGSQLQIHIGKNYHIMPEINEQLSVKNHKKTQEIK